MVEAIALARKEGRKIPNIVTSPHEFVGLCAAHGHALVSGQAQAVVVHRPRLVTRSMSALRTAAVAGVGVVQLPAMMVADELRSGRLVRLLPDWAPRREVVHAVFPSRRGLLPAVRALVDHLGEQFGTLGED